MMPAYLEQPHERQEADEGSRSAQAGAPSGRGIKEERAVEETGRARVTHEVAFAGPLVYCVRCANFAHRRVGSGIKAMCWAPTNRRANAVAARLARLRQGLHPISGRALTEISRGE